MLSEINFGAIIGSLNSCMDGCRASWKDEVAQSYSCMNDNIIDFVKDDANRYLLTQKIYNSVIQSKQSDDFNTNYSRLSDKVSGA